MPSRHTRGTRGNGRNSRAAAGPPRRSLVQSPSWGNRHIRAAAASDEIAFTSASTRPEPAGRRSGLSARGARWRSPRAAVRPQSPRGPRRSRSPGGQASDRQEEAPDQPDPEIADPPEAEDHHGQPGRHRQGAPYHHPFQRHRPSPLPAVRARVRCLVWAERIGTANGLGLLPHLVAALHPANRSQYRCRTLAKLGLAHLREGYAKTDPPHPPWRSECSIAMKQEVGRNPVR
jgi:hypothetical protein